MARELREDAKGVAFEARGGFGAQVPLGGGKRKARMCPHAKCLADAQRRAELATEIVRSLLNSGRDDDELLTTAIRQACDVPDDKIDDVRRGYMVIVGRPLPSKDKPLPAGVSFEKFAEGLHDGGLHKRFPDHVGALDADTAADYERLLRLYVNPTIGPLPLKAIALDHALDVMRKAPAHLSAARRRQIAQIMHRVLAVAAFPARMIASSPLPRGFLPKLGPARGKVTPEIAEERAVLGLPEETAPVVERLLLGYLAREGGRKEEAASLEWGDTRKADAFGWVDLEAGKVYLNEHKTDGSVAARDPWKLGDDVIEALRRWRKLHKRARYVFPADDGGPRNVAKLPERMRAYYMAAGAKRLELHESTKTRRRLVVHDLRALFCTMAIARGESEGWIKSRTGHTTSDMLAKYKRAASSFGEGSEARLAPLHLAVPELRLPGESDPSEGETEPQTCRKQGSEPVETSDAEGYESASFPLVNSAALYSGSSALKSVRVQVPPFAQSVEVARQTSGTNEAFAGPEKASANASAVSDTSRSADELLALSIERASAAGAWDVVATLAAELRERRLAAAGVPDLGAVRARRGRP